MCILRRVPLLINKLDIILETIRQKYVPTGVRDKFQEYKIKIMLLSLFDVEQIMYACTYKLFCNSMYTR